MNIIEKLSNITIDDIKNIDIEEIKDHLVSRPDIIIMIVCASLCLGSIVYGFSNYNSKSKNYIKEIASLKKKKKELDKHGKTQKNYDKLVKDFPQNIEKDFLAKIISDFAANDDMSITSFSPGGIEVLSFVTFQNFTLSVTTPSDKYDNLILFIKDIESSPYAIRMQSWKSSMGGSSSRKRRRTKTNQEKLIQSTIVLQLITLNK